MVKRMFFIYCVSRGPPQLLYITIFRKSETIKRAEGVVVPDVPSDFDLGIDAFDGAVNFTINFLLAVSPELLPRQDLRIVQQQSPERHEVSIARTLIVPRGAHKFIQFNQALSRPFDGNAALSSFLAAMLAEARDRRSSSEPAVM